MGFFLRELRDIREVEEFFDDLFSSVRVEADEILYEKYMEARGETDFTRRRPGKSLAKIRGYIVPEDVATVSAAGVPIVSRIVANPAVEISGDRARIYLRLASIGSEFARTFIAAADLKVEDLKGRIKVDAKPLLYGIMPYECVEDPRIDPDMPGVLYHVRAFYRTRVSRVFTFKSRVVGGEIDGIEAVSFYSRKWGEFLIQDYRDTFPINRGFMTVRPFFKDKGFGIIAIGPREGAQVDFDEIEIPPELLPLNGEDKVGGNASLKLSANEYLLLYHAVDEHGVYYTYGALFDENAELLALTREPIIAPKIGVYSGRRPSTVFVCGAAVYGDSVIISAGVDDEITVIYEVEKQKIYDSLEYLSG